MTRPLVVLVGHGSLPSGLRDAAELILGEQPHLRAVDLAPHQSPTDLRSELVQALGNGTQALVLTDVFGGTPHNVVAVEAAQRADVEVLTGLNLPMLIEVLTSRAATAAELAETALTAGRAGVMHVSMMTRAADG